VVLGWIVIIFQLRMKSMEAGRRGPKSCGQKLLQSDALIYAMCVSFQLNAIGIALIKAMDYASVGLTVCIILRSLFLTIWSVYSIGVCRTLMRNLYKLWLETRRAKGPAQEQAAWAARVVGFELLICAVLGLTTFFPWLFVNILQYIQLTDPVEYKAVRADWSMWLSLFRRFDCVVNTVGLALLSGILWQSKPPSDVDEVTKQKSRSRGMASMSQGLSLDAQAVYKAKVLELANRGFHLYALVDFWEQLLDGQIMPSFDPRRSLTNDVVREAIIPMSRMENYGVALAKVWSGGEDVVPQTMVTHHWTNTFCYLVAAILADALERSVYEEIAALIVTKPGLLSVKQKLTSRALDATYWVCAISVNQHASICQYYGPEPPPHTYEWKAWDRKRYNSVTADPFPLCECDVPKALSTDPMCEVNKFDDMMKLLSGRVEYFGQLIVMDKHFEVLFRAWCVAEIVEANISAVPARIKVFSQETVDLNYDKLSLLDVRDCSASSPADKDMIISKIVDVPAFNTRLQQLVFSTDGLFAEWVDGRERSRQVGRILRRSSAILHDEDLPWCQCCSWRLFGKFRLEEDAESSEGSEADYGTRSQP